MADFPMRPPIITNRGVFNEAPLVGSITFGPARCVGAFDSSPIPPDVWIATGTPNDTVRAVDDDFEGDVSRYAAVQDDE